MDRSKRLSSGSVSQRYNILPSIKPEVDKELLDLETRIVTTCLDSIDSQDRVEPWEKMASLLSELQSLDQAVLNRLQQNSQIVHYIERLLTVVVQSEPANRLSIAQALDIVFPQICAQFAQGDRHVNAKLLSKDVPALPPISPQQAPKKTPSKPLATSKSALKPATKPWPYTAQEVIEYLGTLRARPVPVIDFLYLNYVDGIKANPYNMVVVPKEKAAKNHCIFSNNGVIVISGGETVEVIPLHAWQHQKLVFDHISKIPFFRDFILRKSLMKWKVWLRHHKLLQTGKLIESTLFNSHSTFHPFLRTIVMQIGLMDAAAIQPFDASQSLPVEQFHQIAVNSRESTAFALQKVSLATLDSLSMLRVELDKKIQEVKTELEDVEETKKKSFSLYKDRKRATLDKLSKVQHDRERFVDFLRLTDSIFVENILRISMISYDNVFSPCYGGKPSRLGFLSVVLDFDIRGSLVTVPDVNSFELSIKSQSQEIITSFGAVVRPHLEPSVFQNVQSISELLQSSAHFKQVSQQVYDAIDVAARDIKEFLHVHRWLEAIAVYCLSWGPGSAEEWSSKASGVYQLLSTLTDWIYKLLAVKPLHQVSNNVLLIDCKVIAHKLIPKLSSITQDLDKVLTDAMSDTCTLLLAELHQAVVSMSVFDSIEEFSTITFSEFVLNLHRVESLKPDFHEKINAMQSLFFERRRIDTLLKSASSLRGRLLRQQDDVLVEWRAVQDKLDLGLDLAKRRGPTMVTRILSALDLLETSAIALLNKLNTEMFMEPVNLPGVVLSQLADLDASLNAIDKQANELCFVMETLTHAPHNLPILSQVKLLLSARRETWSTFQSFTAMSASWGETPFENADITGIESSLKEMQSKVRKLREEAEDAVSSHLYHVISELHSQCPALMALKSPALQIRHWRKLFSLWQTPYSLTEQYKLSFFVALNVKEFLPSIQYICHAAQYEHELQAQLRTVVKYWISLTLPMIAMEVKVFSPSRKASEPATFTQPAKRWHDAADRVKNARHESFKRNTSILLELTHFFSSASTCFVLDRQSTFLQVIEHHSMLLQQILESPFLLDEFRHRAERLLHDLHSVSLIVTMLFDTQDLWLYCTTVLSHMFGKPQLADQVQLFLTVDSRFRGILRVLDNHPLAISLLGHTKGQPTYRELQGDKLKVLLSEISVDLEKIVHSLHHAHLDVMRQDFPRFYFLSNHDLIRLVSSSSLVLGSPAQDVLSKCFMGVHHIISTGNGGYNPIDKELIVGLAGTSGVNLLFKEPVTIATDRFLWEIWTKEIELSMKQALQSQLQSAMTHFKANSGLRISRDDMATFVTKFSPQVVRMCIHHCIQTDLREAVTRIDDFRVKLALLKVLVPSFLLTIQALRNDPSSNALALVYDSIALLVASKLCWIDALAEVAVCQDVSASFLWRNSPSYLVTLSDVQVSVGNDLVSYGWEFMGGETDYYSSTPSSDRFIQQTLVALNSFQSMLLHGPASAGKASAVRHASVFCGRFHIDIRPGASMNLNFMGQFLLGSVASGSWLSVSLADLDLSVLAFLGEFSQTVANAFAAKLDKLQAFGSIFNSPIQFGQALFISVSLPVSRDISIELPPCVRHSTRSISLLGPDPSHVFEVTLTALGLPRRLAGDLALLVQQGTCLISSLSRHHFSLKHVVNFVCTSGFEAAKKGSLTISSFIQELYYCYALVVPSSDMNTLAELFVEIFQPDEKLDSQKATDFSEHLFDLHLPILLEKMSLQADQNFTVGVQRLFKVVHFNPSQRLFLVSGPPRSGKSTAINVVQQVLLRMNVDSEHPVGTDLLHCPRFYPNNYSASELFGESSTLSSSPRGKLADFIERSCLNWPSSVPRIVILDGQPKSLWMEPLFHAVNEGKFSFSAGCGVTTSLPNVIFVVECDVNHADVTLSGQCCPRVEIASRPSVSLVRALDTWSQQSLSISHPHLFNVVVEELSQWCERLFPLVLPSILSGNTAISEIDIFDLFLALFSQLLDSQASIPDQPQEKHKCIRSCATFSFIWCFAVSCVSVEQLNQFNAQFLKLVPSVFPSLFFPPATKSVFDLGIDPSTFLFVPLEVTLCDNLNLGDQDAVVLTPYLQNLAKVIGFLSGIRGGKLIHMVAEQRSGRTCFLTHVLSQKFSQIPHTVQFSSFTNLQSLRQLITLHPKLDPHNQMWTLASTFSTESRAGHPPPLLVDNLQLMSDEDEESLQDFFREWFETGQVYFPSTRSHVHVSSLPVTICTAPFVVLGSRVANCFHRINFLPVYSQAAMSDVVRLSLAPWVSELPQTPASQPLLQLTGLVPALFAHAISDTRHMVAESTGVAIFLVAEKVLTLLHSDAHLFELKMGVEAAMTYLISAICQALSVVLLDPYLHSEPNFHTITDALTSIIYSAVSQVHANPKWKTAIHQILARRFTCAGMITGFMSMQAAQRAPLKMPRASVYAPKVSSRHRFSMVSDLSEVTQHFVEREFGDGFVSYFDQFLASMLRVDDALYGQKQRGPVFLHSLVPCGKLTILKTLCSHRKMKLLHSSLNSASILEQTINRACLEAASGLSVVLLVRIQSSDNVAPEALKLLKSVLESPLSSVALRMLTDVSLIHNGSQSASTLFPLFRMAHNILHSLKVVVSWSGHPQSAPHGIASMIGSLCHRIAIDAWTKESKEMVVKQLCDALLAKSMKLYSSIDDPDIVPVISGYDEHLRQLFIRITEYTCAQLKIPASPFLLTRLVKKFDRTFWWYLVPASVRLSEYRWITDNVAAVDQAIEKLNATIESTKERYAVLNNQENEAEQVVMAAQEKANEISHARISLNQYVHSLTREVDRAARDATAQLQLLGPLFDDAVKAIKSLRKEDFDELRSYVSPPDIVLFAVRPLCLLFRSKITYSKAAEPWDPRLPGPSQEPTWIEARLLFNRDNFFSELEFFDKEGLEPALLAMLMAHVSDSRFDLARMRRASIVAEAIGQWVKALCEYADVYFLNKPHTTKLAQARSRLNESKIALEAKELEESEALLQVEREKLVSKGIAKKMQRLEAQMAQYRQHSAELLQARTKISPFFDFIQQQMGDVHAALTTIIGDILLCSACAVFAPSNRHEEQTRFISSWTTLCQQHNIPIRTNWSVVDVLSASEQRALWAFYDLPLAQQSTLGALLLASIQTFGASIISDPNGYAMHLIGRWAASLNQELRVASVNSESFEETVKKAQVDQAILCIVDARPLPGQPLFEAYPVLNLLRSKDEDCIEEHEFDPAETIFNLQSVRRGSTTGTMHRLSISNPRPRRETLVDYSHLETKSQAFIILSSPHTPGNFSYLTTSFDDQACISDMLLPMIWQMENKDSFNDMRDLLDRIARNHLDMTSYCRATRYFLKGVKEFEKALSRQRQSSVAIVGLPDEPLVTEDEEDASQVSVSNNWLELSQLHSEARSSVLSASNKLKNLKGDRQSLGIVSDAHQLAVLYTQLRQIANSTFIDFQRFCLLCQEGFRIGKNQATVDLGPEGRLGKVVSNVFGAASEELLGSQRTALALNFLVWRCLEAGTIHPVEWQLLIESLGSKAQNSPTAIIGTITEKLQSIPEYSSVLSSMLTSPDEWDRFFSSPPSLTSSLPCQAELQGFSPLVNLFRKLLLWSLAAPLQIPRLVAQFTQLCAPECVPLDNPKFEIAVGASKAIKASVVFLTSRERSQTVAQWVCRWSTVRSSVFFSTNLLHDHLMDSEKSLRAIVLPSQSASTTLGNMEETSALRKKSVLTNPPISSNQSLTQDSSVGPAKLSVAVDRCIAYYQSSMHLSQLDEGLAQLQQKSEKGEAVVLEDWSRLSPQTQNTIALRLNTILHSPKLDPNWRLFIGLCPKSLVRFKNDSFVLPFAAQYSEGTGTNVVARVQSLFKSILCSETMKPQEAIFDSIKGMGRRTTGKLSVSDFSEVAMQKNIDFIGQMHRFRLVIHSILFRCCALVVVIERESDTFCFISAGTVRSWLAQFQAIIQEAAQTKQCPDLDALDLARRVFGQISEATLDCSQQKYVASRCQRLVKFVWDFITIPLDTDQSPVTLVGLFGAYSTKLGELDALYPCFDSIQYLKTQTQESEDLRSLLAEPLYAPQATAVVEEFDIVLLKSRLTKAQTLLTQIQLSLAMENEFSGIDVHHGGMLKLAVSQIAGEIELLLDDIDSQLNWALRCGSSSNASVVRSLSGEAGNIVASLKKCLEQLEADLKIFSTVTLNDDSLPGAAMASTVSMVIPKLQSLAALKTQQALRSFVVSFHLPSEASRSFVSLKLTQLKIIGAAWDEARQQLCAEGSSSLSLLIAFDAHATASKERNAVSPWSMQCPIFARDTLGSEKFIGVVQLPCSSESISLRNVSIKL